MAIAYRAGSTAGDGSGGNLTVDKPTGTADGDILVAVLYREAGTWTLPSGWAQWGSDQRNSGSTMYLTVAWKRASSEGASWTFNLSTTTWRIIAIGAFSGCLASGDPIDVGPSGSGTSAAAPAVVSITTTTANTMTVACHANYNGANVQNTTPASGMTQGAELGGCEIWYLAQASAGASGTRTWAPVGDGSWATHHLALKEATAGGTVIPVLMQAYRRRN